MADQDDIIAFLRLHTPSFIKLDIVFLGDINSIKNFNAEKYFHFDEYFPSSTPLPLFGAFASLAFSRPSIVRRLLIFSFISFSEKGSISCSADNGNI